MSLEEVFLTLTGKKLRDYAEGELWDATDIDQK
jgi:hypothetical protein